MNNDNGANDAPYNGERPIVGQLETERQELQRRRLEHRMHFEFKQEQQQLLQERAQLLRDIEQLCQANERLCQANDDADARIVLTNRWRRPFQVQAITDHVLARAQQQQQLADSAEEDSDTVSPAMVELNPESNDIGQQQ